MATGTLSTSTGALSRRVNLSIWTLAAFVAVDLLLVAACLFALRQNAELRGDLANETAMLTPAKGAVMPPLLGLDWLGNTRTIAYGKDFRPTVIYTFTKECGYYQHNWRAMHSLQALSPGRLRIVYVDTNQDIFTPEYLTANGMGQSVLLVHLSRGSAVPYDARAVPQLVLVGHDGRVQWSHVGELVPADVSKALSLIEQE